MTASPTRTRPSKSSGLSYHSASYWNHRFITDPRESSGFEWLSSSTSLLSLLTTSPAPLLLRDPPIHILHIGVGTSSLSLDILKYWRQQFPADWMYRAKNIVNVDFSPNSVDFQRRAECQWLGEIGEDGDVELMEYRIVDLLDWHQVESVLGQGEPFDLVLDKSTTDSISTGEDTAFTCIKGDTHHPSLLQLARSKIGVVGGVATTQVLGIHLSSIVKPDGLWYCHSYSSDRWDDVISPSEAAAADIWPWKQTDKTSVAVESSDPNAPLINHYIYTMQRS
ncbi:hypothetical protein PHSY_000217 [Pseudozyma hubeiensis SY62]|uniref:Uncharacterized protein n=1 Tax=Pseudozyma hubeiensis (strain SY62) TaxID=1305764 RepID=R9NVW4_PSEHS|nr:hypothetical protein PHSY_000217 [Pseudozyma hubeiensis SY62]GAC92663.1 hypothetical protein PHSY_000217 [Pseudozyma hubeiensis SY62]